MRIIGWNPLSLSAVYRQTEISQALTNYSLVLLAGTQLRQDDGSPITKTKMEEHLAVHSGWKKGGRFTNKSAGVSIWIGKDVKETDIKQIETPPPELGGRGMMMRIKTQRYDYTALVLYHPPKTATPRDLPRYKQTVQKLNKWANGVLKDTPSRSTPIVYVDLNDGLEQGCRRVPVWKHHGRSRQIVPKHARRLRDDGGQHPLRHGTHVLEPAGHNIDNRLPLYPAGGTTEGSDV